MKSEYVYPERPETLGFFLHYEKQGQLHPVSESSESTAPSFLESPHFLLCAISSFVSLYREHFSQILPSTDFFLKNGMCFC